MSVSCVSRKERPGGRRKLVLEEFAPYRIVALSHAVSGWLARAYRDENITIPEWRVLAVIGEAEKVAARDVVKRTPMDKMTVSRAVASLEHKGFVIRATDEGDRRVSSLRLSVEGRRLFDRIAALALAYEENLLEALTADEVETFLAVLTKLEARTREG